MIVVGLHFGHDGCVCVLRDGLLVAYVTRERFGRIKHAIGITNAELQLALAEAGITPAQIDAYSVTTTQQMEMVTGLIDDLSLSFHPHPKDHVYSSTLDLCTRHGVSIDSRLTYQLRDIFGDPKMKDIPAFQHYLAFLPEMNRHVRGEVQAVGCLNDFIHVDAWDGAKTLDDIAESNVSDLYRDRGVRYGFHFPLTVVLQGHAAPGYFIQHHMAHLASSYYRSCYDEGIVFSHDGYSPGNDYNAGLIGIGRGREIVATMPHHLVLGNVYESTALMLLSDTTGGGPGKLMGLAPYGKPRFYEPRFAGNWHEVQAFAKTEHSDAWNEFCKREVEKHYGSSSATLRQFCDRRYATAPINADVAASTQKLFEEGMLRAIVAAYKMAANSGLRSDNLCLSGGAALNCPANSKVYRDSPFERIYVEPNCTDDGLAIGSALYVYHQLYEQPLDLNVAKENQSPFQGPLVSAQRAKEVIEISSGITAARPSQRDFAKQAAQDLADNKIVAWFEGRSEMGPRSLGHRSIFANPRHKENWERLNRIKKREPWRPFAPVVLEAYAKDWFTHTQLPSPYMLFTAYVKSRDLPAITHVDNSARIQTVNPQDGDFYGVIAAFHEITGIPVVLNTSFNGPRQPIIEDPVDAIRFLKESEIDVLYMEGYRITEPTASDA